MNRCMSEFNEFLWSHCEWWILIFRGFYPNGFIGYCPREQQQHRQWELSNIECWNSEFTKANFLKIVARFTLNENYRKLIVLRLTTYFCIIIDYQLKEISQIIDVFLCLCVTGFLMKTNYIRNIKTDCSGLSLLLNVLGLSQLLIYSNWKKYRGIVVWHWNV